MGSATKEEPSAEAEADEQPPEADHFTGGSRFAALESLPGDSAPAASSEGAASGSSSSGNTFEEAACCWEDLCGGPELQDHAGP